MVMEEFGYSSTSVGYYAGMLTSALNFASLFALYEFFHLSKRQLPSFGVYMPLISLILSYLSDVYGRKPLLLTGLFGNIIRYILYAST